MKIVALHKEDQDRAIFDPWTVVHFATGLGLGLLDINFYLTMGASVLHELLELRPETMKFWKSKPESIGNVTIDLVTVALGWYLGQAYNGGQPQRRTNPATISARPRAVTAGMRRRA